MLRAGGGWRDQATEGLEGQDPEHGPSPAGNCKLLIKGVTVENDILGFSSRWYAGWTKVRKTSQESITQSRSKRRPCA